MNQDKYTILGLLVVILILGIILGVRVVARQNNISIAIAEASSSGGSTVNQAMDFDKYIGNNKKYEDIQAMLTEIETYVIGASNINLSDRKIITLNLTTNKTAGTLADYSNTIRDIKQNTITEGHTYNVNLKNGLKETTKTMEIIVI